MSKKNKIEEERRWFVTLPNGSNEDVGADECGVSPAGALVFHRREDRTPTFIYAPGQWTFVEFQGED